MASKHKTTLTVEDREVAIEFTVQPYEPETGPTYACGGTPAVPAHVEDVTVLTVDGKAPHISLRTAFEVIIQNFRQAEMLEAASQEDQD